MDRRTWIAVALSLLFLLFYQPLLRWAGLGRYLEPARPRATAPPGPRPDSVIATRIDTAGVPAPARRDDIARPEPVPVAVAPFRPAQQVIERTYTIETPLHVATFTNRGARLLSVELKHHASAHGASAAAGGLPPRPRKGQPVPPDDRVVLAGGPSLGLDLGSGDALRPLDEVVYAVAESLDAAGQVRTLAFTARDSAGLLVRQTWRAHPDDYSFDYAVEVGGVPASWRLDDYSITVRSWPTRTESDLAGDERALRATSLVGANLHREGVGGLLKGVKRFSGDARFAGVQSRYFLGAVVAVDATTREVRSGAVQRAAVGGTEARGARAVQTFATNTLVAGLPSPARPVHRFVVYFGPSDHRRLDRIGSGLERVVDLGWTWIRPISQLMLHVLTWIHVVVRNYGLAILVLATLVRLLLHPLNMASIKSMRAMQKLQPEMERLKEKYKKDPQAMNAAVMALYRENKVNPAGGCLPILVQMPIFLALYQVLFNAIELRQSPFVAWMHDLSAPDLLFTAGGIPIRLLPILMAGSGLLQQKLTPTPPQQAMTAYLMNVFMLVFFYNLPSGLVLYWTVMNLLSALQQWLALRHESPSKAVVVESPVPARRSGKKPARH